MARPDLNREIGSGKRIQSEENHPTRWKTAAEQRTYSSKLFAALQQARQNPPATTSAAPAPSRTVQEAAYRILAKAARGRTRWSRAILASRLKMMTIGRRRKTLLQTRKGKERIFPSPPPALPILQRKIRTLGRLVPGCRKLSFPVLLEEVTDYIAALEMQVRAMASLTQLLSSNANGHADAGSPADH